MGCIGSMRYRKECWLPLSPPWTFGSSWPNFLLGLVKPIFINSTTHCLTYYSTKQGLNKGPILLLFYCSLIHLCKSSHLLLPMWRVWETHVDLGHLGWSPIESFWACPLLLGLLMGLKVYLVLILGLLGSHHTFSSWRQLVRITGDSVPNTVTFHLKQNINNTNNK